MAISQRQEVLISLAKFIQSNAVRDPIEGVGFASYMNNIGDKGDFLKPLFEGSIPKSWVYGGEQLSKQISIWEKNFRLNNKVPTQREIIVYLRSNV